MNNLSVISQSTDIAANISNIVSNITQNMDTRTARKLRNKLGYDIQTIATCQQLAEMMGIKGHNQDRVEMLLNAFTTKALEDILDT